MPNSGYQFHLIFSIKEYLPRATYLLWLLCPCSYPSLHVLAVWCLSNKNRSDNFPTQTMVASHSPRDSRHLPEGEYSRARIICTKICEIFGWIKQNVWIIHISKSMGKHTIVRIKQNVRIIHGSHYPGSTVNESRNQYSLTCIFVTLLPSVTESGKFMRNVIQPFSILINYIRDQTANTYKHTERPNWIQNSYPTEYFFSWVCIKRNIY